MHVHAVSCVATVAAAAVARVLVAVIGIAGVGCRVTTAPVDGRRVDPPASYAVWWQEVERCSGLTGDVSRIAWYVVPCAPGETGFSCPDTPDHLCAGEWLPPHTIVLAGPNRILPDGYLTDEWTVKHEMLHDLTGSPEHPALFKNCHVALR
jgi:hypothetical protein